ncbi:MAG: hypothetical protein Ct9H300mP5_5350 [Candidatus Pelagibacterales bacterium]|nr:MAG: hypothetical protein Ct9H300mP5_5350 [Pelagibacterales bacterium]
MEVCCNNNNRDFKKFEIDDVVGAIPVHLAAGIWGTLAVGIFSDLETLGTGLARFEQIKIQLIGIVHRFIFIFYFIYIIKNFKYFYPLRVAYSRRVRT